MGSAATRNVHPSSNDGTHISCYSEQLCDELDRTKEPQVCRSDETERGILADKVLKLEGQIEKFQKLNSDLEEQVRVLKTQLLQEQEANQAWQTRWDINEVKNFEKELNSLKIKYKKKLKKASAHLAEAKQEWSLEVFELKQEICRLTESNSQLTGPQHPDTLAESCDNRMKIIVELSQKVSEQDAEIAALKARIEEEEEVRECCPSLGTHARMAMAQRKPSLT